MKQKFLVVFALVAMACTVFGGASKGNCQSKAVGLKSSQTVELVDEWDPDIGYLETGTYYYKVRLTKNYAYTIWITGGNTDNMDVFIYTDWEDEDAPIASFTQEDFKDGAIKASFMYSDEWSEDDPSTGVYYIQISGDIGNTANLFFTEGIQNFTEEGEEGNPKRLTFTESVQTHSATLLGVGEYYYAAYLEAGRKYRFRLNRGNAAAPLSLFVEGANYWVEDDPAAPNAPIKLIYPGETADYTFIISTTNSADTGASFNIAYYAYGTRLPEDHDNVQDLTSGNGYSVEMQPGREVADADKYYDAVIDESLSRIKVNAGERWVFQTRGGNIPMKMRVYNSAGKTLNENTGMNSATNDCRTAVETSYDGYYYVGVCDPSLDVVNEPTASNVVVFAKKAEDFDGVNDYDVFDPFDDTQSGATLLVAYPGSVSNKVVNVAKPNGPHVLSGGDWYDWYVLPGRKGVTYALKAKFSTLATSEIDLNGVVYKQVGTTRTRMSTVGTLKPDDVAVSTAPLTFTADEDAMYYVCVYASTGGQDYPAHDMYAMAYYPGVDMGLVQVDVKGLDGTWSLSSGGFAYPDGATVVAPVGRTFSAVFPAVEGFKPSSTVISTNVIAYVAGESEDIPVITCLYTDKYDHEDDVYTGFVKINPSSTTSKALRTLWTDDPADHMCFKSKDGLFYNFAIVDRTDYGGDAVLSIHHVTGTSLDEPIVEGASSFLKQNLPSGVYIVKVSHVDDAYPVDTAYALTYNCVDVGTVQFSAKSVTVSEDAEYAQVVVTRTSGNGAIRLNFATEAFTATPGKEYYPTNGILEWADGDATAKTINIRLIPDLRKEWDNTLYFGVNIWPMPEDSWGDGEYGAVISGSSKIPVKLAESSAKATGTIGVKTEPRTVAGTPMLVTLSRTGGTDGSVGVVVSTVNGSAVRGTEFAFVQTNVVWEAGDASDKTFTVPTVALGSLEAKTVVLKMASLKTVFPAQYGSLDEPSAISSDNTTATIESEVLSRTFEDLMAEPSFAGIRGTQMTGSLYVDTTGALRSSAPSAWGKVMFRFGVTGPGLFVMEPRLENADEGSSFKFQVSGGEILDCHEGDRLVVAVPAGYRNIAFVARSPSGTAYASFQPLSETGLPFKWIPFSSVQALEPRDGAVVPVDAPTVSWTKPAGLASEEIWYRVKASAKGTDSSTFTAVFTNMTTETSCVVPAGLLRAGRQFWWRVDYVYVGSAKDEPEESDWMEGPAVWTFKAIASGGPATVPSALATDVNGTSIASLIAAGKPVEAVQGTRIDFNLAASDDGDVAGASVLGGSLPLGVKLTSAGRVYGVPRNSGDFASIVQVNGGTSMVLDFHVAPIGSAAGSFCGVLAEDGASKDVFSAIGALSFAVTEAGALSSKVKVGGASYSFESSGYEEVLERDDSAEGQTMMLQTRMYDSEIIRGVVCTNVLEVAVGSGSTSNVVALGQSAGTARLTLFVDDGGIPREVEYTCELVRRNSDSEEFKEAMSAFAGYYTVSIVPYGASAAAGLPCGNGPMAVTVSTDGSVKIAGVLPDRTAFSSSAFCALRGDLSDPSKMDLLVPIVYSASPNSFGGLMRIRYASDDIGGVETPACYVDSWTLLGWNKSGGAFDGSDFRIDTNPVGGWYDTVLNLQRYYLDRDFSVEAEPVSGIPEGMLPAGYTYTVDTTPHGVEASLAGDILKTAESSIVKTEDGSRIDFSSSINAWNVTVSFARGSGLVKGTAMVVSDGETQKDLGIVNHCGILLMNRDAAAPLDADVWTAGLYQFPAGNGWKHCLPFNIKSISVDRDWSEVLVPPEE